MLTARPPWEVSSYFESMSAPVSRIVLITLSRADVMLAVSEQSHPSRVDGLYRTDRVPFYAGDLNHSVHGSDQDGACNEPSQLVGI
jgi:hypothetical protein